MKSVKPSAMRCTVAVVTLGALAAMPCFPRDASIATVHAQQVEGPRAGDSDFGGPLPSGGPPTPSISQEETGILGRYKATQDETERKTIVQELTAEVERQFEARQSKRAAELKELRERLTRLDAIHARRFQEKARIINDRVEQLLRDVDGIGWGQDLQESPGEIVYESGARGERILRELPPGTPMLLSPSTPGGAALKPLPAGEVRSDNGLNMKLVWIPPGNFQQGSQDGDASERPVHAVVILHGFFLGQTEVTKSQWEAMMQTRPWEGKENVNEAKDTPATHVSWEDAVAFCQQFNDKERQDGRLQTGWRYTLPTESQWEYACRGRISSRYSFGDDETALGDFAWYAKNALNVGEKHAHQVGVKRPNRFGLYDMHGNVSEWCRDWYDIKYYRRLSDRNPVGPVAGISRVFRGGSWNSPPAFCRSAYRNGRDPSNLDNDLGFRVALIPWSD